MIKIYEEGMDVLDTFEAYFKDVIVKRDTLFFPYINVGVFNHPLNRHKEMFFLDYSYVVCTGISLITYNGQKMYENIFNVSEDQRYIHLGGTDIKTDVNVGYEIIYKAAFLQVNEDLILSKTFWIPVKSSYSNPNMEKDKVSNFFDLKNLPSNLVEMFF